jgi:hypothetical protein
MIARGEADVSLRLQVAQAGLVAGGRLSPPIDPTPWIKEAEEAAAEISRGVLDDLARDQLNWQLGLAYYHATEIQHRRGDPESALKYGDLAVATLTPLAEARHELPDTGYILGRLNFQIGAVHAVHHENHEVACEWYGKASDNLLQPTPLTDFASPGHHGDALVSMGVSYWEIGQRERAYDLTKAGADLVQQGVEDGLLNVKQLTVAHSNLSAMSQALGKTSPVRAEPRTQMAQNNRKASAKRTADRRANAPAGARRR